MTAQTRTEKERLFAVREDIMTVTRAHWQTKRPIDPIAFHNLFARAIQALDDAPGVPVVVVEAARARHESLLHNHYDDGKHVGKCESCDTALALRRWLETLS